MHLKTSVLGLAAGLLLSGSAIPQTIEGAPPAATRFNIGRAEAWSLQDGRGAFPNNGKTFGLGVDPSEMARVLASRGATADSIPVSVDALLVKANGRVMLFDTGLGPKFHGSLIGSLGIAGVKPDEVTDVFITHGHGDHIGGLLDGAAKSAFPKAAIHMSDAEWAWLRSQRGAAALVAGIGPQVRTFALGAEIVPGVTSLSVPGHTPGHTAYVIRFGRDALVDIGDTAHSSIVSLARPDWKIEFDTDKDLGAKNRQGELSRLAAGHARVFAPHFPYPGVGRIDRTADGYRWVPEAFPKPGPLN